MNKGKKLEKDVKTFLKHNAYFFHQFTDSFASRNFSQPVPADFIIWPTKGPSMLLECKESQTERVSLSAFRPKQFKAMRQTLKVKNCNYYVLINYNRSYYLIGAETILNILDSDEKSIHLEDGFLAISAINQAMVMLMADNVSEL